MEIIVRVIKSLLTSVFVSLILFVVVFSVVTNEFPPRINRMKAGLDNMQKLMQMTQEALLAKQEELLAKSNQRNDNKLKSKEVTKDKMGPLDMSNDETFVEDMQKMNKKHRTLGEHIFGMGDDIESAPSLSSPPASEIKSELKALRSEVAELKILVKQVKLQQAELKETLQRR